MLICLINLGLLFVVFILKFFKIFCNLGFVFLYILILKLLVVDNNLVLINFFIEFIILKLLLVRYLLVNIFFLINLFILVCNINKLCVFMFISFYFFIFVF